MLFQYRYSDVHDILFIGLQASSSVWVLCTVYDLCIMQGPAVEVVTGKRVETCAYTVITIWR